jgi:catechol 2,3-dioxygenase-like lactoylglutathione lyase family enzyme
VSALMIDHFTLKVRNFARSKSFLLAALKPLGYQVIMEFAAQKTAGLGAGGKPDLWIVEDPGNARPTHFALHAPDRSTVDAFHAAALAAGARDNGKPGLRPHYHPSYYGAFVLDDDGHNIEVVCHRPE